MYVAVKRLSLPLPSFPLLWYSWPKARKKERKREDDVSLFICNVVVVVAKRRGARFSIRGTNCTAAIDV